MPYDPSIIPNMIAQSIATSRQPREESVYERVARFKALQDEQKMRGLQMEGAQLGLQQQKQAYSEDQAFKDKLRAGAGFDELVKANPTAALKLREQQLAIATKEAESKIKHFDAIKGQHEQVASVVGGALQYAPGPQRDMYWVGNVVPKLKQLGIPDGEIPAQGAPDDNYIKAQLYEGMTGVQQVERMQKDTADAHARLIAEFDNLRKQQDHDTTLPGKQADAQVKQTEAAQVGQFGMTLDKKLTHDQTTARDKQTANYQAQRLGIERQRVALQQKATESQLSNEAAQAQAQAFANGVPLNQLIKGRGRQAEADAANILNKAVALKPGLNIAEAMANYKADSGSLAKQVAMSDNVEAFERTALANLDLMLNASKKLVDSGSPMINIPLRKLQGQVLGSEGQAAYDAARQVAMNEIAKLTSDPAMKGVVSDHSRDEIKKLNPESATLKQIYAVANILKQDMVNRKRGTHEQMGDIRGRMGGAKQDARQSDPLGIR